MNQNGKRVPVEKMTSEDFQTDAYAHIEVFAHLLKDQDKTVLDVGCGIGIFSLFAAKAGAARVFAVDPSSATQYARQIAVDNHYGHVIQVIQGRIQDVELPIEPNSIDIIISDWMGYCLIYESIIDAIIFARDKWLKPGGLIFPDRAKLHVAALEDTYRKNAKINWWQNVYGYNMNCIREFALREPRFSSAKPDQVITSTHLLKDINMNTVKIEELNFLTPFLMETKRTSTIDGIITYFNVTFSKSHTRFGFNTAPWSSPTHWMQTIFYFDQPIPAKLGDTFFGAFAIKPINNSMDNIEVRIEILTGDPLQMVGNIQCSLRRRGVPMKDDERIGNGFETTNNSEH